MGVNACRKAQKTLKAKVINVSEDKGIVSVDIDWSMRYLKNMHTKYCFGADGSIDISFKLVHMFCIVQHIYGVRMNCHFKRLVNGTQAVIIVINFNKNSKVALKVVLLFIFYGIYEK